MADSAHGRGSGAGVVGQRPAPFPKLPAPAGRGRTLRRRSRARRLPVRLPALREALDREGLMGDERQRAIRDRADALVTDLRRLAETDPERLSAVDSWCWRLTLSLAPRRPRGRSRSRPIRFPSSSMASWNCSPTGRRARLTAKPSDPQYSSAPSRASRLPSLHGGRVGPGGELTARRASHARHRLRRGLEGRLDDHLLRGERRAQELQAGAGLARTG